MKKAVSLFLIVVLLLSCMPTAFAVDDSRTYFFELAVDGGDTKQVQTGDIITVVFTLYRTDSDEPVDMYAMQNEIRYDSTFFKLVEGSELLSSGISSTDIGMRDDYREFYMNFVSMSGGEEWEAERMVGSFQLEVIGESGTSKITNENYLVSTADGSDSYQASCQDVTVVLSTDCLVTFESNGGTEVESQKVIYGEPVKRPTDPVREGYELEAWCSDLDLQEPWDFEQDTVRGNMTLYAKWQKAGSGPIAPQNPGDGGSKLTLLLGIAALVVLLLLGFFLLTGKKVYFETGCTARVKQQTVRKGKLVSCPANPRQLGKTFEGWYQDEDCLEKWDFAHDRVVDHMILYAKWI